MWNFTHMITSFLMSRGPVKSDAKDHSWNMTGDHSYDHFIWCDQCLSLRHMITLELVHWSWLRGVWNMWQEPVCRPLSWNYFATLHCPVNLLNLLMQDSAHFCLSCLKGNPGVFKLKRASSISKINFDCVSSAVWGWKSNAANNANENCESEPQQYR